MKLKLLTNNGHKTWGGRGGGVLFTPDAQMETKFSWGLGSETNIIAEALALWKGLWISKNQGITELTVLGDLRIIIQAMVENSLPNQLHLRHLIKKIKNLAFSFLKIHFFHVLRLHNKEAGLTTNLGTTLGLRSLLINGINSFCAPP